MSASKRRSICQSSKNLDCTRGRRCDERQRGEGGRAAASESEKQREREEMQQERESAHTSPVSAIDTDNCKKESHRHNDT